MGRRHGGWPERVPRPKTAKLSRQEQQRLQARATKLVGESLIRNVGPIPQHTCLYALTDGEWGCYTIKPSASETIATAKTCLNKRDWEDWC